MKAIYLCAVADIFQIYSFLKRSQFSHINLLKGLKLELGDWYNYLRMDYETYCTLLKLVTPLIVKQDTQLRKAITPHERL